MCFAVKRFRLCTFEATCYYIGKEERILENRSSTFLLIINVVLLIKFSDIELVAGVISLV